MNGLRVCDRVRESRIPRQSGAGVGVSMGIGTGVGLGLGEVPAEVSSAIAAEDPTLAAPRVSRQQVVMSPIKGRWNFTLRAYIGAKSLVSRAESQIFSRWLCQA
jgi:hypothetical protein